jgi:hypothetical protein
MMLRRGGGFEELRGVLALTKAELMWVQRERDKAHFGRYAALQGTATATRERDKTRLERDVVHAKEREARDATRKGWDDLVMLVEEERAEILKERVDMEFKIVEATMAERERWESRIRAAENGGGP